MRNAVCLFWLLMVAPSHVFAQSSVDKLRGSSDKAREVYDRSVQQKVSIADTGTDSVFTLVQVQEQPEFPGGPSAMYNYLAKHFHYPDSLADNGAGGKVYVEFIIEPSGSIDQVRIKRGSQHALDEEALRVVKAMPAWRPAKMDGHAVAARMILPINYEPR